MAYGCVPPDPLLRLPSHRTAVVGAVRCEVHDMTRAFRGVFLRFLRLLRALLPPAHRRVLSSAVRSSRSAKGVLGTRVGWLRALEIRQPAGPDGSGSPHT
jgi:hypothetical protein